MIPFRICRLPEEFWLKEGKDEATVITAACFKKFLRLVWRVFINALWYQASLFRPGIAMGATGKGIFHSRCAGTSFSSEFNACSHEISSPVYAAMRPIMAVIEVYASRNPLLIGLPARIEAN